MLQRTFKVISKVLLMLTSVWFTKAFDKEWASLRGTHCGGAHVIVFIASSQSLWCSLTLTIHSSTHFCWSFQGGWEQAKEPIPAGWEAGYTLHRMPVCCIVDTQRQITNYTCINTHLQSSINLIHWIGWDSPWLPSWKMCSRIRESNSLFPLGRWMMWVFWFNQVVASWIWIRYDNWHMQLWSHYFLPEKGDGPNFKFNLSTLSTRRLTGRLMQHLQWCGWSTVLICCAEERAERYVAQ